MNNIIIAKRKLIAPSQALLKGFTLTYHHKALLLSVSLLLNMQDSECTFATLPDDMGVISHRGLDKNKVGGKERSFRV